jgi:glucokinase
MDSLLEMMPVRLVLNPNVGLIGAAVCAAGL